jgi:hypothetical protein
MKVGNLVKRRYSPRGYEQNLGLVIELETQQWNNVRLCEVKWIHGIDQPPFKYCAEDLLLISETK